MPMICSSLKRLLRMRPLLFFQADFLLSPGDHLGEHVTGIAATPNVWPLQHPIVASIGWSLLLLAVFVPLAMRVYRTATTQ
jgi:hypothetical protein